MDVRSADGTRIAALAVLSLAFLVAGCDAGAPTVPAEAGSRSSVRSLESGDHTGTVREITVRSDEDGRAGTIRRIRVQ